jgi:hypothetical protein
MITWKKFVGKMGLFLADGSIVDNALLYPIVPVHFNCDDRFEEERSEGLKLDGMTSQFFT